MYFNVNFKSIPEDKENPRSRALDAIWKFFDIIFVFGVFKNPWVTIVDAYKRKSRKNYRRCGHESGLWAPDASGAFFDIEFVFIVFRNP